MKIYSPKERLNLELPNLFNYATKELSQDAFLCWALEWANTDGDKMCDFTNALLQSFINESSYKNKISLSEIENVELKRQYKNIDVLILLHLKNKKVLPIIIEDKVNTSEHSNQLCRYREKIVNEKFEEPICIYYKTGYIFELNSHIQNCKYIIFDKKKMINIMKKFEDDKMNLLFCDYYEHLINKKSYEDKIISAYDEAIKNDDIEILTNTLNIDFAQWELMSRLMKNVEIDAQKNIRKGNNPNGHPWTIYDIDDSYLKGGDLAFYRIDRNKDGYYLSLRQYLKYDSTEYMKNTGISDKEILYKDKMERLKLYRECFEESVISIKPKPSIIIYKSNKGAYESEIGSFKLNSIETLVWLENNLETITNTFLKLVKNKK